MKRRVEGYIHEPDINPLEGVIVAEEELEEQSKEDHPGQGKKDK